MITELLLLDGDGVYYELAFGGCNSIYKYPEDNLHEEYESK